MNLEIIILNEVSQTEKHKKQMVLILCELFLKNELIHKTEIDPQT